MEDLQALRAWTISNGGTCHPDTEFALDSEAGSFLRVKPDSRSIPPKSTAITCPHSLTISHLNALDVFPFQCHGPTFPQSFIKHASIHTIDVFFLCQQYLRGKKSYWWPYIRTLPGPVDREALKTPLWYNEEDRKWLSGTNMEKGYMDREKEWKERWREGVELLKIASWDTTGYTWELACWAATIFSSRSFVSTLLLEMDLQNLKTEAGGNIISRDDPFPVLFPLVDILNHSPDTRIEWNTGPSTLSLVTLDEVCPGEPVLNNYGPKSNEELLLGYGFCLDKNPFDHVALKFKPPLTVKQQSELRSMVDNNQIKTLPSDDIYYVRQSPEGDSSKIPTNVEEFGVFDARLVSLMGLLVSNQREMHDFRKTSRLGHRQRLAVAMQLKEALRYKIKAIKSYDGGIPLTPINSRQRNADIYRNSQLWIMESSKRSLESFLAEASQRTISEERLPVLLDLRSAVELLHRMMNNDLYTHWKKFLRQLFGSTKLAELCKVGWEDTLWVLWVCMMYISREPAPQDMHVSTARIYAWMEYMIERYYDPSSIGGDVPVIAATGDVLGPEVDEIISLVEAMDSDRSESTKSFFAAPHWNRRVIHWACLLVHDESIKIQVDDLVSEQLFLCLRNGPTGE